MAMRLCALLLGLAVALGAPALHAQGRPAAPAALAPSAAALWRQARAHLAAGAPRAALPLLERLVSDHPGHARLRLALARALYKVDRNDRARLHFDRALAGRLSLRQITAVQQYLREMDSRKRWHGRARIALVPQTNPRRRSGNSFVSIGGRFVLPLPDVERATGLEFGLGGTWTPRIAPDLYGRGHVMATAQVFRQSTFNQGHIRAELGLESRGDHRRRLVGGLTLQAAGGHNGVVMRGVGVHAAFSRRFGRRTQLQLRGTLDRLRYPDAPEYDGRMLALTARVAHVLSPRLRLTGDIGYTRHRTAAPFHRRSALTLGAGGDIALAGGLVAGLEARLGRVRYTQANPLLAQYGPRRDWRATLGATLMRRDLAVRGFAPRIKLSVTRNRSNVPMHGFRNIKLSLGATRDF